MNPAPVTAVSAKPTRALLRPPALFDKLGGVSPEFVDALIANEGFPKPLTVSKRVLLWDEVLVDEWIERKSREAQRPQKAA